MADLQYVFTQFALGTASIVNQAPSPTDCEVNNTCGSVLYYFHPDHVGSSTFLSDGNGLPYQFLLYLPFGESMAEQKAGGFGNRYKFNGKEQDALSGLYYYGARFYDPVISVWLEVDPEMEKYPDWSAYNFTMNNPIKFVDPDGRNPKLAKMLIKTAYKTYTKLKKMGKFSKDNFMKALKDSGVEEIVDIAGDLFTIVDPTSSWIDVTKAIIDVTTGLETNNKGNKAAEEAMDKASDLVKGSKKTGDKVGQAKNAPKGARTEPRDLQEKLALDEAKGSKGEKIMEGRLKDDKFDPKTGTHDKRKHNHDHGDGTSTEIHWDQNRITGERSGYKIKDDTNKNSRGYLKNEGT